MNIIEKLVQEEIKAIIFGNKDKTIDDSKSLKIVILNRGWVVVGRFSRNGDMCKLTDTSIIRNWGTTKGIGEIAINGPTSKTVLDKITDLEFHILTTVAMVECREDKWK